MEKIPRSPTKEFKNILCVIEESKDLTILSIDELAGSLEAHKQRRRTILFKSLDHVLQAKLDLKGGAQNTRGQVGLKGRGRGGCGKMMMEVIMKMTRSKLVSAWSWGKGRPRRSIK